MEMKKNTSKKAANNPRPRHVPERTCIACRAKHSKQGFIRIVRADDGVAIDGTGKKSGRGAYLCPFYECWIMGLKGSRLDHALHTKLKEIERQMLVGYANDLPRRR
jgi:predicted RNA-binding protein YlxR (DUF448 family)